MRSSDLFFLVKGGQQGPSQVAQLVRASSQYTKVVGLIHSQGNTIINKWMHKYVEQQVNLSHPQINKK